MNQHAYKDVRVVLCETNPALRSGLQGVLHGKGFRDLTICRDGNSLVAALDEEVIDLVVCDADLPGLDFCVMAQQLRQKTFGRNPFTLIISVVSDASVGEVRRMVNAGVDRILRKPTPMFALGEHVDALMVSRKPFVATEHYIGPTRRNNRRSSEDAEDLILVPNTLRSKVIDRTGPARLQALINEGWARLVDLKARTSSAGINQVIHRILAYYRGEGSYDSLLADLDRLAILGEDMRVRNRGSADHIADLASSVISVSMRIAEQPNEPQNIHLQLLAKLGEVMRRSLKVKTQSADVVQQIAETVGRFSAAPWRRIH